MDMGVLLIGLAFAMGGILKGATGAGAPIIAVPLIAMLYDVRMAVAVFALPNIASNFLQVWRFRAERVEGVSLRFAGAAAAGTFLGTLALTALHADFLLLLVAAAVFLYIGFRVARPGWVLPLPLARVLAAPVGLVSGALFGASGVSAPVSLTFVNAIGLARPNFISTVSTLFVAMGAVQVPMLLWYGILTLDTALLGAAAMLPLLAGMWVGAWLARFLSKQTFDVTILGMLCLLAVKLVWDVLA